MRELSETFMNDLLSPDGKLQPILTRVKNDQTLMCAVRQVPGEEFQGLPFVRG